MTTITTLPTPPARTQAAAVFDTNADAFLGALPAFGSQTNAVALEVNANAIAAAASQVAAAASQVASNASQILAAASAATAVASPTTAGTATDSLLIQLGSKSFTTQTGKNFALGQSIKIAYTVDPTKWMLGDLTAYNSGTGLTTILVNTIQGSGTFASWTISLSAPANVDPTWAIVTGNYTSAARDNIMVNTTSAVANVTLPNSGLVTGVTRINIRDYAGTFQTNNLTVLRNGNNIEGLAQDMTVTNKSISFGLLYIDATRGWVIV